MSSLADSAKNTQKYYERSLNDFAHQMFDDPNLGYGPNYFLNNNHSILGNNLNSIDIARITSNPQHSRM